MSNRNTASALITTKSGINSNSYNTMEAADSYFQDTWGAEEWFGLTEDDKRRLLITATKHIDNLPAAYDKASSIQALNFPVSTIFNIDEEIDDGWEEVQEAVLLQAYHILEHTETIKATKANKVAGIKSRTSGRYSETSVGFNPWSQFSSGARRLLSPYLNLTIRIRRG